MRTITKRIEHVSAVEPGDKVTASVRRRPSMRSDHEEEVVVSGTAWKIGAAGALSVSGLVTLRHSNGQRDPNVLHWSATREIPAPPETGWLTDVTTKSGRHLAYAYRDDPDKAWLGFDTPHRLLSRDGCFFEDTDLVSWSVAEMPVSEPQTKGKTDDIEEML